MSLNEDTKDVTEETNVTSPDTETQEESVDWKGEADRLRAENEKLADVSRKQAGALREERKKRKQVETEDVSQDTGLDKALSRIEKKRIDDEIEEQLFDLVENADEREVVKHYYNERLQPSGFTRRKIQEDIKLARIMANKSKVQAEAERKARKSLAEKQALENTSTQVRSSVEEGAANKPKYNKKEKAFLRQYGVKVD
jgi:Zn-dependent metalloprotease